MEYMAIPKSITGINKYAAVPKITMEKDAASPIASGIGKLWNLGSNWAKQQGTLRAAREMLLKKGRPITQMAEKSKAGYEAAKTQWAAIPKKMNQRQFQLQNKIQTLQGNKNFFERQNISPTLQSVGEKFRLSRIGSAQKGIQQAKSKSTMAEQKLQEALKSHRQTMANVQSQKSALRKEYAAAPKMSQKEIQFGTNIRNITGRGAILGAGAAVAIPAVGAVNRYRQNQYYQPQQQPQY